MYRILVIELCRYLDDMHGKGILASLTINALLQIWHITFWQLNRHPLPKMPIGLRCQRVSWSFPWTLTGRHQYAWLC